MSDGDTTSSSSQMSCAAGDIPELSKAETNSLIAAVDAATTSGAPHPWAEQSGGAGGTSPPAAVLVGIPQVGDRCRVHWRGGEVLAAEIVARRPSNNKSGRLPSRASWSRSSVSNNAAASSSSATAASGGAGGRGGSRKRMGGGGSTTTSGDSSEGEPATEPVPFASTSSATAAKFDVSHIDDPRGIEYYVHYVGHDRRLDEWIGVDKIQVESLQRGGGAAATALSGDPSLDDSRHPQQVQLLTTTTLARRRSSAALGAAEANNLQGMCDNSDEPTLLGGPMGGGNWHSHDPTFEKAHEEETKIKNVEWIVMGSHLVQCWYYAAFPDPYSNLSTLYVCEYCLAYMKRASTYKRHRKKCGVRCPPGKSIYLEGQVTVYEIDGTDHKAYCQKLCLLAKLFLDHKTLYYDVTPFLFYVVCIVDEIGEKMVGYFSKEKVSDQGYNLACILTLPQYQDKGFGKFIISLSYELTKREGKTGSPEKPLSDLGKVSYRSYWTHVLMTLLNDHDPAQDLSIADISTRTGIKTEDIISTLQSLDTIKVWKGQHVAYIKQSMLRSYFNLQSNKPPFRQCKPEFLIWEPSS